MVWSGRPRPLLLTLPLTLPVARAFALDVARVERTLLSLAFDVGFALDSWPSLTLIWISCRPGRPRNRGRTALQRRIRFP